MPARPLRRLVAVSACSAFLLGAQAASSAPADLGTRGARRGGEPGSGPEAWSVHTQAPDAGIVWSDVPDDHWARTAIDHVGATNNWMRDKKAAADGTFAFQPDKLESRKRLSRTLFRAFGTPVEPDPALVFPDLPVEDRFYRFAAISVAAGWLEVDERGAFRPDEAVTTREVHRALVTAIGMQDLAAGAQALHFRDGTTVEMPKDFGTLLIGMRLGLRYNHGDEALDVAPDTPLPRSEVAWSLYRATTAPSWVRDSLAPYLTMQLPNLSKKLRHVVAFAVNYVGHPYVWGGEWNEPTSSGYCCGSQPVGGFDCSGFVWWLMKAEDLGWDNTPPRAYAGWALPQRSSAHMASVGKPLAWDAIRAGDLLFYDGNGDGTVDHVNTYLGNGWAADSGGSNGGATITYVAGTWYEEHFVHGRRILG